MSEKVSEILFKKMQENLLSTPSQAKKRIGFISQVWVCLKLQFRVRKTSSIFKSFDFYFSIITFGLLFLNVMSMTNSQQQITEPYTSKVDSRTIIEFLNYTDEIYFYPDNEKSHEFSKYYITNNLTSIVKFLNSSNQVEYLMSEYGNISIPCDKNVFLFSIENQSQTSKIDDDLVKINYRFNDVHTHFDSLLSIHVVNTAFSDVSIPSNQSLNLDYIQYTMNPTENITVINYTDAFMTTISYHLCVGLLLLFHMMYITYLISKKGFFIINSSGVPEKAIWLSTILLESIYILIISIIFSLTMLGHPEYAITDFFTIFVFIFYMGFTFVISLIAFVPLFVHITLIVVFFCCVEAFILVDMILGLFQSDFPLIKYDCYFMPLGNLIPFATLLIRGYYEQKPVHLWDSRSVSERFNLQQIFLNLTYQLLVYTFLFVFNILFIPRQYGKPKIGFKNIFKSRYWKNIFRSTIIKKEYPSYPFIEVADLSKTYKNRLVSIKAIDNVEFSIEKGDNIVIIGPNGSGKSTLLQMMNGSLIPDQCSLKIFGQNGDFSDLTSMIGFCSQDNIFFPTLTVYEHLEFFGILRGLTDKQLLKREINLFIEMFSLSNLMNQRADKLSGGIARLLSTANAYIGSPSLVILDEPTAGLDVKNRQLIWRCTTIFNNTTTIISSHSLEDAENVATKFFILNKGNIIFKGNSAELRKNYGTGYRLLPVFSDKNIDDEKSLEILKSIFDYVKETIPDAKIDNERNFCILVPVSDAVPDLIERLYEKLNDFSCDAFNLQIEALEDSLLRLVIDYDE